MAVSTEWRNRTLNKEVFLHNSPVCPTVGLLKSTQLKNKIGLYISATHFYKCYFAPANPILTQKTYILSK